MELHSQRSCGLEADTLDVLCMQVGDVLYLPRGTVHQAEASADGPSSHVTISTYQHWAWGDLATHVLTAALGAANQVGGSGPCWSVPFA